MINLFKNTSSNWVRYDKYKWKEDKAGTLYITPSPDAQPSLYDPLKDSEQLVLKAVNLGLMCMDKKNTKEQLQDAIMDFVTCYGLLGFMTALPTTPYTFLSIAANTTQSTSAVIPTTPPTI